LFIFVKKKNLPLLSNTRGIVLGQITINVIMIQFQPISTND